MSLRSYLLKRLVYTVVLIFFVIVVNWLIFLALPGLTSAQYTLIANRGKVTQAQYDQLNAQLGLDKDPLTRFLDYVRSMLTFHFGYSYTSNLDVATEMISSGRLMNTLILIGSSTVAAIVIGVLLGILSARKRGSTSDSFLVTTSLTTYSLPTFYIGIILILLLAYNLGWFPAGGAYPNEWNLGPSHIPSVLVQFLVRLRYITLPALTLTLFSYGGFLLLTRATMLEVLSEDYIVTARAKGLPERVVLLHHAFKNASLPVITASALSFGAILGGAIITETLFNYQGLGLWLFHAVLANDFPVMQAMFYIIALCVIAANFISDIMYGIVDPRIKYE